MTKVRDIVLWVPGTSNHDVHPAFKAAMAQRGHEVQVVRYPATWDFPLSTPEGVRQLMLALRELHINRKPGQRILVAGESQGAMVISNTLAHPFYRRIVDKAALMGHPGASHTHFHEPNDKVLELNHRRDPATFQWTEDRRNLLQAVSRLFIHHDLTTIPFFVSLLLRHPIEAVMAAMVGLRKIPGLRDVFPDVHNYSGDMQAAAGWLLTRSKSLAYPEVHNAH